MQKENDSHDESQETHHRKAWEAPEVEVLLVDQTENSSVQSTDSIFFAS
jgi:hypothetical protein